MMAYANISLIYKGHILQIFFNIDFLAGYLGLVVSLEETATATPG